MRASGLFRRLLPVFAAAAVLAGRPAFPADLHIRGESRVVDSDLVVDGSIFIEQGGVLTLRNATLRMRLSYDEEHAIVLTENGKFIVDNGIVDSEGGQYFIEVNGEGDAPASMEVHGAASRITNHSGIRPTGRARVTVTGGDVEELQARDEAVVSVANAAVYPVFFFDAGDSLLTEVRTGTSITSTIQQSGGWRFDLLNAAVEGYQIDMRSGAAVTLDGGEGIVLSIHTPGNLGSELRIVDGVTSDAAAAGAVTNLGSSFVFTRSQIILLNVYTSGTDRVLLRKVHVNEVNAADRSELVVGQKGAQTLLNCNLCQVYDQARFTVVAATMDASGNVPSATSSYADVDTVGRGVMRFADTDLRRVQLTARDHGTLLLDNSPHDPSRLAVLDATARFATTSLSADFTATRLSGRAPLAVEFLDLSAGNIDAWQWDFGDGARSTLANPIHTYAAPGRYAVSLTVRGSAGEATSIRTEYIVVEPAPRRRRAVRR